MRIDDCEGKDLTVSCKPDDPDGGAVPDDKKEAMVGLTSVCWKDGANPAYPAVVGEPCKGKPIWCTYKNVRAEECTLGVNPSMMWKCVYE